MSEAIAKKNNLFYVHVAITLLFMFGFGYLPPLEPITVMGMKMLGIFIGLIYAWTTTSLLWRLLSECWQLLLPESTPWRILPRYPSVMKPWSL